MQLLADAYALVRFAYADDTEQIASIFAHYQSGMLSSYLMEITASILRYQEWDGTFLIHHILDVAKQKGTGKWVVQTAIEEGIAVPSIEQAVSSRFLSEQKICAMNWLRIMKKATGKPLRHIHQRTGRSALFHEDHDLCPRLCFYAENQ